MTPVSTLEPVSNEATTIPTEALTLESKTVTQAMDSTKIAPTDSQIIHKLMTTDATTSIATSLPTSMPTSIADVKTLQPVFSESTTEKSIITEQMSTMKSEIPVTASTELATSTTVEEKTMSPMTTISVPPASLAPETLQASTSATKTAESNTVDIATSFGTSTTLETKQATELVTSEIRTSTEVCHIRYMIYHGSPIRKVLLSNVIEIADSHLDSVREEDLSEWRSMVPSELFLGKQILKK